MFDIIHARCNRETQIHMYAKSVSVLNLIFYVRWLFLLGQTPLHLAASNSYAKDTLQLLLLHPDIRTDVTNGTGERPVDLAQRCGRYGYLFETVETCVNILWCRRHVRFGVYFCEVCILVDYCVPMYICIPWNYLWSCKCNKDPIWKFCCFRSTVT